MSGNALAALFKAEIAPVSYNGSVPVATPLIFSTAAGTAQCQTVSFSGTNNASSPTAELPVSFGAGSCTNFGEKNKSIVANGCAFKFALGKLISEGTLEIVCPPSKSIEIQKTGCTVSIGSQKPVSNISFTWSGSGANRFFEPKFEIKDGLVHTVKGAFCGTAEGTDTHGGITGTALVKGANGQNIQAYGSNDPDAGQARLAASTQRPRASPHQTPSGTTQRDRDLRRGSGSRRAGHDRGRADATAYGQLSLRFDADRLTIAENWRIEYKYRFRGTTQPGGE
jgi:hypothetical protein